MAISDRPDEPQQVMLLPASLQDWLPEGHRACCIGDTVDALDLGTFHARYAGGGERDQPFHPATMRGRSPHDDRKPHDDNNSNATGGRFKRAFGVADPKAQDNITDPHSRTMKRARGGFGASDNGQTAVDDTAHTIGAAELGNNASEPPNGWIKSVRGFRQFSPRGLHRVQAEWTLGCLALNHAAHGRDERSETAD